MIIEPFTSFSMKPGDFCHSLLKFGTNVCLMCDVDPETVEVKSEITHHLDLILQLTCSYKSQPTLFLSVLSPISGFNVPIL